MRVALQHDLWTCPGSEAELLSDVQHSGISDNKVADGIPSMIHNKHREPEPDPASEAPGTGIESGDSESAVLRITHREDTDVVRHVLSPGEIDMKTFVQHEVSTNDPAQNSGKQMSGPDSGAMDPNSPEPIIQGSMAVEPNDGFEISSDTKILQPAIQTELHLVGAILDGAQDGIMSVQSSSEEAPIRHMMRSAVEVNAVDDENEVAGAAATAGQLSRAQMVAVTVAPAIHEPNSVDNGATRSLGEWLAVVMTGPAPATMSDTSVNHLPKTSVGWTIVKDLVAMDSTIDSVPENSEAMETDQRTTESSSSIAMTTPIDLCTPESYAAPRQTLLIDDREMSALVDTDEKMDVDNEKPVPSDQPDAETSPQTAIHQRAVSIGSKAPSVQTGRIEVNKASSAAKIDATGAATLKRKASEGASNEAPMKKSKLAVSAPLTKATSNTASRKNLPGSMAKATTKSPASESASLSTEVVTIDSGPSRPASQSAIPPPRPIASNAKRPASGESGKPTGTPSPTKDGVESTRTAATPEPKATVADTKKPIANKTDKGTATPRITGDDEVQVTVSAKMKPKTAAVTPKDATASQTASKTTTLSVAEDDDFGDQDDDEDDEPGSEVGNKDIQTPIRPACSRCKVIMRKELKGTHDKAMKALKKAHETALAAQKKKFNQSIADQKASLEKKAKTAADSHEKAIEKLEARLEKSKEASIEKIKDLKEKHETKVESLTNDLEEAVAKRREVEKAATAALKKHREDMQAKDDKLKEEIRKMKLAKKAELDYLKPEFSTAIKDKMREIRELTINKERLEKALSESTADAEAQSKAAEKWQMDYTAGERRKLRAKKRVEELEGELDAIRKSGLGANPNVRAMRDDYEDELEEMRGRVDRARRNEVESGHRVVAEQRALFSMRAANEGHKARAEEAEKVAAKAELENKVLRGMVASLSGRGGGRADVEMSG
ncbi:hypothetical protein B0A48_05963 [Cryoendolithus antarcticus]|uniref:Uncharacterized protein n=1 Tax=Cryoendolithus antarcticus TaxID=1507870 RepID=A0A1V8TCY7_9PEZI|nr:hypothetical protein B0A48_05963 [Cryoendolithus antarcticus]